MDLHNLSQHASKTQAHHSPKPPAVQEKRNDTRH